MAFLPVGNIAPNYRDFKNYWFKAYEPGTTTPKTIALDSTGSPTAAKLQLDKDGFIESSGNAIVMPHLEGNYDAYLFPTEAEADANDTVNATQVADNLSGAVTESFVNGEFDRRYKDTTTDWANDADVVLSDNVVHIKENNTVWDIIQGTSTANGRNIVGHNTLDLSIVERLPVETYAAFTWNVDPVLGVDAYGQGVSTEGGAFKTIQGAIDFLPDVILHQQTIQLVAGTYNESNRAASSMPRASVVWPNDKVITRRTAQDGTELEGKIVIKGNDKTDTFIETFTDFPYGVYASGTEIALQDLTVKGGIAGTQTLITGHRSGYVHTLDCDVDGNSLANIGIAAESGGVVEAVSTDTFDNSNDLVVFADSLISFAKGTYGTSVVTGDLDIAVGATATGDQTVSNGGDFRSTGLSGTRNTISGNITVNQGLYVGIFTDNTGQITARCGDVRMSASGFSEQMTIDGGSVSLDGAQSFVAPATQSNVLDPVILTGSATERIDATTELRDNNGDLTGVSYFRQLAQVNADGFVIPLSLTGEVSVIEVNGSGANRINCTLDTSVQNKLAGTPPPDGAVLELIGSGFAVTIIDGTTATIPGGSIQLGTAATPGAYSGATFVYSKLNSAWKLTSVGDQW